MDGALVSLDLHYRTPEIGFQVVKLKRTTSETLKGGIFERKTRNLLTRNFLNKSNISLQLPLPLPSWFRKLPIYLCQLTLMLTERTKLLVILFIVKFSGKNMQPMQRYIILFSIGTPCWLS